MNRRQFRSFRSWALSGVAVAAIASPAWAQDARRFEIPQQSLIAALEAFGKQGDAEILFSRAAAEGRATSGVTGDYEPAQALTMLLDGSGLKYRQVNANTYVVEAADPQGGSAAGGGAEVEALIVTAQKREEDIQDVPIAMSAFTQETLERSQIAGGPDLMTQVPNMTFTKTNFSSYSIQIRGIGTQAISATVDPAVAVAFNNTPFIRNRFFEQEFYDLQRVEVLRGPQGTLYGRNATAGVVNIITQRPRHQFEAKLSGDVSNYSSTRLEGMVNLPLVEGAVALRVAGAWTKRDGYVTNQLSGEQIDGRDLWSTRATLAFEPTESLRAYLTYEHFEEDDDRLRSGKQLCTRDNGIGSGEASDVNATQGCVMGSLYTADAFQVPHGAALPYYIPIKQLGAPFALGDPYESTVQSRDLRVIESAVEPVYQAKTDMLHLAVAWDVTPHMSLSSETGYGADELFSFQDFNRFNTAPGAWATSGTLQSQRALATGLLSADGVFCDPQLGCSDRLVAADVSTAKSRQFVQELRLSSNLDGALNFHVGANYLRYDTEDKYYVFANSLTIYSALSTGEQLAGLPWIPGVSDNSSCLMSFQTVNPFEPEINNGCRYIDPNPIGSLNDNGRNYFLSKNPFKLISYAVFGELQYNITDEVKMTAGLRYTVDKKKAPIIPSWLLTGAYGTPVKRVVDQEWREPTGRLVIDWKPDLEFTDESLIYASYAHGYKAGGANPPLPGGLPLSSVYDTAGSIAIIEAIQPPEFGPEFVDAFELGSKNTLLEDRLVLNGSAFYYDYEGYQISQIVNRSALNLNFDAEVWGAELEADWRPVENLKIGLRGGYQKTRIGDGQTATDMIDRTAGVEGWSVVKPFPTNPSNCIFPTWLVENYWPRTGGKQPCTEAYFLGLDPVTSMPYVPNPTVWRSTVDAAVSPLPAQFAGYPGFDPGVVPNNGFGFLKDLGGNELPNAPNFTTTLTVDYTLPLANDWLVTLHADLYRQSEAWTRIFNEDPYDRLEPFTQVNLAAIFTSEETGWHVMAYVKNAFDKDNITGAFLNSDDTGLTTNVFLNEPRLYGLRVTKRWDGGSPGGWLAARTQEGPYPFTIEVGGGALRLDAPNETYAPDFVDSFSSPAMPMPLEAQEQDLDWGDTRRLKLVYRPARSPWKATLGARFGRTNGVDFQETAEQAPPGWLGPVGFEFPPLCGVTCFKQGPDRFAQVRNRDREDFTVVDFTVGRELGLGLLGDTTVHAGLRYAQLDAETQADIHGTPNYTIPAAFAFGSPTTFLTMYHAVMAAQRSFEGTGPILALDGDVEMFGDAERGRLGVEWAVNGGVLFGRQQTTIDHSEDGYHYPGFRFYNDGANAPSQRGTRQHIIDDTTMESRRDDATVPVFGASLGVSYRIKGVSVGAGYEWERYFDVLDGGIDEPEQVDRTIHGPYFKIAVGFGG